MKKNPKTIPVQSALFDNSDAGLSRLAHTRAISVSRAPVSVVQTTIQPAGASPHAGDLFSKTALFDRLGVVDAMLANIIGDHDVSEDDLQTWLDDAEIERERAARKLAEKAEREAEDRRLREVEEAEEARKAAEWAAYRAAFLDDLYPDLADA